MSHVDDQLGASIGNNDSRPHMRRLPSISALFLLGLLVFSSSTFTAGARDADTITWKPLEDAQLKLEGRPLKKWNVYAAEKKKNLVLILLGRRYLVIDLKARAVYELAPNPQQKGQELQTDDPTTSEKPLATSEWLVRDVGPAELVRVRLGDYGRTVEVQLPHRPDLRWAY